MSHATRRNVSSFEVWSWQCSSIGFNDARSCTKTSYWCTGLRGVNFTLLIYWQLVLCSHTPLSMLPQIERRFFHRQNYYLTQPHCVYHQPRTQEFSNSCFFAPLIKGSLSCEFCFLSHRTRQNMWMRIEDSSWNEQIPSRRSKNLQIICSLWFEDFFLSCFSIKTTLFFS